jgi:hypothetical protein
LLASVLDRRNSPANLPLGRRNRIYSETPAEALDELIRFVFGFIDALAFVFDEPFEEAATRAVYAIVTPAA